MIVTFFLWCLITLVVLAFGISFSKLLVLTGIFLENETDFYRICLLGLALFSTLLAIISLFAPIGSIVFFLLTGISAIQLIFYRRDLKELFKERISWQRILLFSLIGFVILLYAIKSDYSDSDTGMYHAKTIQWIERYPAVPGLGNLQAELAFNPHFLLLSAFFSLSFTGIPFHALNSWLVLFFCLFCIKKYLESTNFKRKAIYCLLFFICCFLYRWALILPSTDISIAIFTWILFIEIIESYNLESKNKKYNTLIFILIIGAFTLTCKLSFITLFAGIFILAIYRKWKEGFEAFFKITGLLFILLSPWVARNIIVSGYPAFPVYPLARLGIFNFSWRVPENNVKKLETLLTSETASPGYFLKTSGIIQRLPTVPYINIYQAGIGNWFNYQGLDNKVYFITLLFSFLFTIIFAVPKIMLRNQFYNQVLIIWLILLGTFIFWFTVGPSVRYFQGTLWICVCIPIILAPGLKIKSRNHIISFSKYLIPLIILYFLKAPIVEIFTGKEKISKYVILPEPRYPKIETISFLENNFQATSPKTGCRCWNEDLPCLPCKLQYVKMRGATFRDGFVSTEYK